MSDITEKQVQEHLSIIRRMASEGRTIAEVSVALDNPTNNIRALMARHGIPLPDAWKPRAKKKHGKQTDEESPLLPDMTLPADCLTDEQVESAHRIGIRPERLAWLLSCEFSATARGLAVTR